MHNLPELKLDHLFNLTDSTGIFQHARYHIPDRNHGYSIDDNARALMVMAQLKKFGVAFSQLEKWVDIYLSFVDHAYNPVTKRYRNFMSYSREWLEEEGSEDSQGRTMWAVGVLYADDEFQYYHQYLEKLWAQSWEMEFYSPLSISFGLLGLTQISKAKKNRTNIMARIEIEAEKLANFFQDTENYWPWFHEKITYDCCRIPQAMMEAGFVLSSPLLIKQGLKILDWLISHQFDKGIFMPIGNENWMTISRKSIYDQQPLEASAMIDACLKAGTLTQKSHYYTYAHQAFLWFLGKNIKTEFLYDPFTGGCRDGIGKEGVNKNQGAESTLAWLSALLTVNNHQKLLFQEPKPSILYESS
jgi:hypothetical protein